MTIIELNEKVELTVKLPSHKSSCLSGPMVFISNSKKAVKLMKNSEVLKLLI
jgi:hypothetical protein